LPVSSDHEARGSPVPSAVKRRQSCPGVLPLRTGNEILEGKYVAQQQRENKTLDRIRSYVKVQIN